MRLIRYALGALQRHASTAIVAATVAALTAGGPAIAGSVVDFARNADKVDGRHAVGAGASPTERAGKLVATNGAGRLPSDIIAHAPDSDRLGGQDLAGVVAAARGGLQERVTGTCSAAQALSAIQADGSVTCSSRYKRTVVVSPGDTPTQSGAALYDAIWTVQQNNTGLDRYLIVLEPGVYNIGTGIELPQYIDLQGAGRAATVIKATGWPGANDFYSGAAIRAQGFYDNGITIRDLTIEQNAAPGDHAAALTLVNTALELDNVALTVNGGAAVAGLRVYVAAFLPRLKDVEINAYSGESGAVVDGIAIGSGNMLVDGGKVSASANGQGATANGIRVGTEGAASLQLQDVDVSAGGTTPVAVRIKDGSVTAYNSRIGSSGYAVLADPGTTNWMLYSVLGGERAGPLTCAESLESSSFAALGADCS